VFKDYQLARFGVIIQAVAKNAAYNLGDNFYCIISSRTPVSGSGCDSVRVVRGTSAMCDCDGRWMNAALMAIVNRCHWNAGAGTRNQLEDREDVVSLCHQAQHVDQ